MVPTCRSRDLLSASITESTSKLNAYLWTAILAWILLSLALLDKSDFSIADGKSFAAVVGRISPLYLVLLGGPFAAAVLAKGIVTSSVSEKALVKPAAEKPRVADVFSDDDGNTDLVDTQYVIFNLIVAAMVVIGFWGNPLAGAPSIPDFLAILTGGSAAAYVANKSVNAKADPPVIDRMIPSVARPNDQVRIVGSAFQGQGNEAPTVVIGGEDADILPGSNDGMIVAVVSNLAKPGQCEVVVRTAAGAEGSVAKESGKFVVEADSICITSVSSLTWRSGDTMTLIGSGFMTPGFLSPDGVKIPVPTGTSVYAKVYLVDQENTGSPVECSLHAAGAAQTNLSLTVDIPPNVLAGQVGPRTFSLLSRRDGLESPPGKTVTIAG